MVNPSDVHQDLKLTAHTFRSLILSTNFMRDGSAVTWGGYLSGINGTVHYVEEYDALVNERQYSLLLKDGAFIQAYFRYDEVGLSKGKLAFYPKPMICSTEVAALEERYIEAGDAELERVYDILMEASGDCAAGALRLTNASHFRIDFDRDVKVHSKCHIQFGGINNLRIPLEKMPTPFVFVDFIVSNLFVSEYALIRRREPHVSANVRSLREMSVVDGFVRGGVYATVHTE